MNTSDATPFNHNGAARRVVIGSNGKLPPLEAPAPIDSVETPAWLSVVWAAENQACLASLSHAPDTGQRPKQDEPVVMQRHNDSIYITIVCRNPAYGWQWGAVTSLRLWHVEAYSATYAGHPYYLLRPLTEEAWKTSLAKHYPQHFAELLKHPSVSAALNKL